MSSTQVNNQTIQISTPIFVPYDAVTGNLINGFQTEINFSLLKQLWKESTSFAPSFPYLIKTNENCCEQCFQVVSHPHFCACSRAEPISYEHVTIDSENKVQSTVDETIHKQNEIHQAIEQMQKLFWKEWVQGIPIQNNHNMVDRGASYHKDYTIDNLITQITSTFNMTGTQYCLPTIMDICYQRVLASIVSTCTPNALPSCFESGIAQCQKLEKMEEKNKPEKPKEKPEEPKEKPEPEPVCFSSWPWNVCKVNQVNGNNNFNNNLNRIINSIISAIISAITTAITTTSITLSTTYYLSQYLQYYYLFLVQQQYVLLLQQQLLCSSLLLPLLSLQGSSSHSSTSCTSSCSCQSCFDCGCGNSSLSDRGLSDRGNDDRDCSDFSSSDFSDFSVDMGMQGFRGKFRGNFRHLQCQDFHFHHLHHAMPAARPNAALAYAIAA